MALKNLSNLEHNITWWHGVYVAELPLWKPWFGSPERPNIFSFIATKLVGKNNAGGGSRGYVQVTSADSSRMRGNDGVGMVELVDFSDLLRMGCDSLLVPKWRSV